MEELKSYRDSKQKELANRYQAAYRDGDQKEMEAVKNEAREWNRAAVLSGKPEMLVDLERAVKSRQKAHQPPKKMRGVARDLRESYGM